MMKLRFYNSLFFVHMLVFKTEGAFNDCQTRESCGDCISSSPDCSWCEDIFYQSSKNSYHKKCDLVENHRQQGCQNVTNPPSSSKIDKDAELVGDTRVSPQAITLKLRPSQSTIVNVTVKTPVNFPVDLYYLMDLSLSMKDDKEQIEDLGDILAKEMKNVTENFRLGFGAFVDKPLAPYTLTHNAGIEKYKKDHEAQYTFTYKNYQPLDNDTSLFKKTLKKVKISFNVDPPESSLEALMQVIVCQNNIGWKDKRRARRIVIITTDADFHYSGDGLLGGLVIPNDGKCHLKNNDYTAWDRFDYPSLSQIRSIMVENQIVPIFAVTGNLKLYQKVVDFFGAGSGAVAAALTKNSDNVVPLIKEAYEKIAKIVNINSDAPEGIDVKYTAICRTGNISKDTDFCNDVSIGEKVVFEVELTAKDCSLAKSNPTFKIKTNFDDVNVTLELLCECPCKKDKSKVLVNSTHCTSRGDLICGKCECNREFYAGRFCQCTVEEAKNQTLCQIPGETSPVCSDQGVCECGECICDPPQKNGFGELSYIYGDQCQCSNTTCRRSNKGLLCSGPDHGVCDCGVCKCNENWQGETCADECIKSDIACLDENSVICSGKGNCVCNKCDCDAGYIGDRCQECVSNCPDPCQDYRECVRCRVFETSDLSAEECKTECGKFNISSHTVKDKIPEEKRCIARDEDDCSFVFTFTKDNNTEAIQLIVQSERICPAEPDILAIILGVIAGIVGIGLALLLIWKLLATIQDRREFAKFEKDLQHPKWDSGENPIYKQATSTFQNPMYGNKSGETERMIDP